MATDKNQSAIREVRDQLFVDTADGGRLSIVSGNLGFYRPSVGFSDDEWRAMTKNLALDYKLILPPFRRILEFCIGPRFARVAELEEDVAAGDKIIKMKDVSQLVQIGTIIFDKGQAGEETKEHCFVDYKTNEVYLTSGLSNPHSAKDEAVNYLVNDVTSGSTSITLLNTSGFPTSGFPYTIVLDQGTGVEETVTVTANDTGTNTLTVSALQNDHKGFKPRFLRRPLEKAAPKGRTFLQMDISDTEEFPNKGWVRINANTPKEEIKEVVRNDVSENVLYLKSPLEVIDQHAAGASIEDMEPGAKVAMATVFEEGKHWAIYETDPKNLQIFIPDEEDRLRLIDAGFLHDTVQPVFSTTLASGASSSDTVLELTSVSGLPDEAALLQIDGSQVVFYQFRDEDATPNPTVTLSEEIGTGYSSGTSVDLFRVPYSGTDLEEGNIRNSAGDVQQHRYAGPYIFDITDDSISTVSTALAELIPGPTRMVKDQLAGFTNIEVEDASLFTGIPFSVKIGRGTGFEEDKTVTDVTLAVNTSDSLAVQADPGDTIIEYTNSAANFPETAVANSAGYRVTLADGGTTETVVVLDNNPSDTPNPTLTLQSQLLNTFTAGSTVTLTSDTLTLDQLNKDHKGPKANPTRPGHLVEKRIEEVKLTSAAGFPVIGSLFINFGNAKPSARQKITNKVSSTEYEFADSSVFPTSDFPYQIVLGEGLPIEEVVDVTANDTGTNRLTVTAPINTHLDGEYVEFRTGDQDLITYQDRDLDTLVLDPPQIMNKHTEGETVILSRGLSNPLNNGFSYPFYLPPDPLQCVKDMFDLVRGAGIQVTVIDER